jgi:hypothetical protein
MMPAARLLEFAMRWQAGEAGLGAKHAQVDRGTDELASSVRDEAPAAQRRTRGGSALLMVLVAGLFVGSALISVTLLWLAVRAIRWLLG